MHVSLVHVCGPAFDLNSGNLSGHSLDISGIGWQATEANSAITSAPSLIFGMCLQDIVRGCLQTRIFPSRVTYKYGHTHVHIWNWEIGFTYPLLHFSSKKDRGKRNPELSSKHIHFNSVYEKKKAQSRQNSASVSKLHNQKNSERLDDLIYG